VEGRANLAVSHPHTPWSTCRKLESASTVIERSTSTLFGIRTSILIHSGLLLAVRGMREGRQSVRPSPLLSRFIIFSCPRL